MSRQTSVPLCTDPSTTNRQLCSALCRPMEVPEYVLAAIAAAGSKESIVPNKAAAAAVGSIHGSVGGDGVSDFEARHRLSEGGPLWEWWTKQAVEGGLHRQKGHVIPRDVAAGALPTWRILRT